MFYIIFRAFFKSDMIRFEIYSSGVGCPISIVVLSPVFPPCVGMDVTVCYWSVATGFGARLCWGGGGSVAIRDGF